MSGDVIRVAAVGDLHCGKASPGAFQPLFTRMAERADVVVLCGDLTDYGLPEEARRLSLPPLRPPATLHAHINAAGRTSHGEDRAV